MTPRRLELALWGIAGLCASAAVLGSRAAASGGLRDPSDVLAAPERYVKRSDLGTQDVAPVVEHDPFRILRHPSPVAYKPELEGVTPPPPPPKPPHPTLSLSGILGGPPWEALLEGVPGHDASTLVRAGDVLGALRVRAITRNSVIIEGEDTTWRLGMKRSAP